MIAMWHVVRYPAFGDFRSQEQRRDPGQWRGNFERPEQAEQFIREQIAAGNGTLRDYGIVKTHEVSK